MSNIDDFLSKLVDGSTHIISSPKTIDDLQKKGVKFDPPKFQTEVEILDALFAKRRKEAKSVLSKFPITPQIAIPTIGFLYDEIRECIIFGINGGAISLSAILVEFALKHALVRMICGGYDKKEWERLENIELGPTIQEAKKLELIDEEMEKKLISFKNTIRNPYLHYNIKKLIKNVMAGKVKKVNFKTRKVEELDLPAEDNPVVWGFAKRFVDRERVFDVFGFADYVVKYLFQQLDKKT